MLREIALHHVNVVRAAAERVNDGEDVDAGTVAYSTRVIVRFGANFDTFSVGRQTAWIDRRMLK